MRQGCVWNAIIKLKPRAGLLATAIHLVLTARRIRRLRYGVRLLLDRPKMAGTLALLCSVAHAIFPPCIMLCLQAWTARSPRLVFRPWVCSGERKGEEGTVEKQRGTGRGTEQKWKGKDGVLSLRIFRFNYWSNVKCRYCLPVLQN